MFYYQIAGDFTPAFLSMALGTLTDVRRTSVVSRSFCEWTVIETRWLSESRWENVKGQGN